MKVSDDFVRAFELFNVIDIEDFFEKLSLKEKYLLCITCIDRHDHNDTISLNNFVKISGYLDVILEFQKTGKTKIKELKELTILTESNSIDTKIITDLSGNRLEIWERDKIRDFKIDKICKK